MPNLWYESQCCFFLIGRELWILQFKKAEGNVQDVSWTPIGRKMIENVRFSPISRKECIWNTGKSSKLCVFIINAVRFQKRLKLFWWIPFLLISCYAVIFHVWANNFKIEKRVQIFKLHACHAPKQFWRQTKCCSAKFSSFVGTWGFVIAFPFRYRSSQFVLIWNFLMHDDHNFSLLLLKHLLIKWRLLIIHLHVNLHNWHISLSSLRWNGLNGYFKYSHPDLFSLREVPLMKEWLKFWDKPF